MQLQKCATVLASPSDKEFWNCVRVICVNVTAFAMGFGCGNDGGVIAAQRRFLVKVKQDAPKVDAIEAAAIKWMTCACSGEPLRSPVGVNLP